MPPSGSWVKTNRLIFNVTYLGRRVTLTWGQILTLNFQGKNIFFFSKRLKERNTIVPSTILHLCWFKSDSWKSYIQKQLCSQCLTYGGLTVDLTSIVMMTLSKDEFKSHRLLFHAFLAITVPEITACFLKKNIMTFDTFWPLMTSGDPNVALGWKMTELLSNVRIESYRLLFTASF